MELLIIAAIFWVGGAIFVGFLFSRYLPSYGGWGMGFASLVISPLTGLLAFVLFLVWEKLIKKNSSETLK